MNKLIEQVDCINGLMARDGVKFLDRGLILEDFIFYQKAIFHNAKVLFLQEKYIQSYIRNRFSTS